MRSPNRSRLVASVLVVAMLGAGCGLGDKSRQAEGIQRSVRAAGSAGLVHVTYRLDPDEPALGVRAGALESLAEVDLTKRKARVRIGDDVAPAVVFDGNRIFVRRLNARPTERRTWARFDLGDLSHNRSAGLDDIEAPAIARAVAVAVNPVFLAELVTGALAGSVERDGPETVTGVATTAYRFNLSFDKAMSELDFDDDERAMRLGVFHHLGIRDDVVKARAWLDPAGALRRVALEFSVKLSALESHKLRLLLDLAPAPDDVVISPPPAEATVEYAALGRLLRAGMPAER